VRWDVETLIETLLHVNEAERNQATEALLSNVSSLEQERQSLRDCPNMLVVWNFMQPTLSNKRNASRYSAISAASITCGVSVCCARTDLAVDTGLCCIVV